MCYVDLQNCRRATLKVRLHTTGQIRGVACLHNAMSKVYAVCENYNTINVFHAMPPYEQLRGIYVSGLKQPTDIVACTTNKLLYISDSPAKGCVWQVTTGGKVDVRLPTWTTTRQKINAVCPVSLSARFGRLVVVEANNISVYNLHDDKVNDIKFPDSVTLHHCTETDRRSFVVALTDNSADKGCSTIREMQKDGSGKWFPVHEWKLKSPVTSVTSHPRNSQPLYMTWDVSGFLYVAICDSCRVLVLDNTLNEVRSVRLNRRSVPNRLCFLAQRRKLFLAVDCGFEVDVYDGVIPPLQYPKKQRYVTM